MKTRYKNIVIVASTLLSLSTTANAFWNRKLASVDQEYRKEHIEELLGRRAFLKGELKKTLGFDDIESFILAKAQSELKPKYAQHAFNLAQAVITNANEHGFDPLFVLAVIKHESRFNPEAIGGVGEIGLMQIRPETAKWIAKKFKIEYHGKETLKNPAVNIKIGTAYLAMLRDKFGHGQLYLSAYNMGPKKVRKALAKNVWPKDYSSGVMKKYMLMNQELIREYKLAKAPMVAVNN